MMQVKPTLGWALAHLQTAENEKYQQIAGGNHGYLVQIVKRLNVLTSDGVLSSILESLPDKQCTSDNPFLENNEDYFIALFSNTKYDEACINLYNHLNNCYHCFEIFSQVLREYYRHRPETDPLKRSENK